MRALFASFVMSACVLTLAGCGAPTSDSTSSTSSDGTQQVAAAPSSCDAPATPTIAPHVASKGFTRGKTVNFVSIDGHGRIEGPSALTAEAPRRDGATSAHLYAVAGATALKEEPEVGEAQLATLGFAAPQAKPAPTVADRRAEAKMKGYVGEACPECANFTLVRNGTCLKCDTCGSTTGCS